MQTAVPQSCVEWIQERSQRTAAGGSGHDVDDRSGDLTGPTPARASEMSPTADTSSAPLAVAYTGTEVPAAAAAEGSSGGGGSCGVKILVRDFLTQQNKVCSYVSSCNVNRVEGECEYVQQRRYAELLAGDKDGWQRTILGASISGCVGDQQGACLGHRLFERGAVKCTYGTGAFVLMNTGNCLVNSTKGLLTTPCFQLGQDQPIQWALEGSVGIAGAGVTWLKDNLGVIQSDCDTAAILQSTPDTEGVMFVPAFSGLLAPHWRVEARGCIVGLSQSSRREHIVRALLEGIALQIHDLMVVMRHEAGWSTCVSMCVDGGMARNGPFLQLTSDLTDMPIGAAAAAASLRCGLSGFCQQQSSRRTLK
eukprot:GHVS01055977.1.p1 GENE.GHVS01055977.1~~GHVS01055977.1.p1  ORF type:complete len:365 (-),score=58.19 GHVS01055977.1:519-1613(-)